VDGKKKLVQIPPSLFFFAWSVVLCCVLSSEVLRKPANPVKNKVSIAGIGLVVWQKVK